jgi:tRNA 2-thiouridine synthesizing protein A
MEILVGDGQQVSAKKLESSLGESFIHELAAQDFRSLQLLFKPAARFRAVVPSEEYQVKTAGEAAGVFRDWFGSSDSIQILQSTARPVLDRLYLSYRLRFHDGKDGWQLAEQHAFCIVQEDRIADMWLICSGFRPDLDYSKETVAAATQSDRPALGGDVFYDAGSKGCAEGPLDDIAALLRPMAPGQTLEIHATDPSVTTDLSAWCRLTGHTLVKHAGDHYLVQHK